MDGLRQRRFPGSVRTGDDREDRHTALRCVFRQFTKNLVVFTGRRAGQPANFEFPACGKSLGIGFVTRRPNRVVKLRVGEIACGEPLRLCAPIG
jgi:hypothetical protein